MLSIDMQFMLAKENFYYEN